MSRLTKNICYTENELKEIIRNIYGYNYEIIEEDKKYIQIKPPAGTIFVGKDMKTG